MATRFETIKLQKPIIRGKEKIKQIKITEPNVGALRGIKLTDVINLDVISLGILIPRISDPIISKSEFEQMQMPEVVSIGVAIANFFSRD